MPGTLNSLDQICPSSSTRLGDQLLDRSRKRAYVLPGRSIKDIPGWAATSEEATVLAYLDGLVTEVVDQIE